ncbi:hypothetical protein ACFSCX_23625 [Bacillus salitolerans]|uniref:Uncharacterized protein n=1 Tax=Bacillus salitolerans TaxID=1437434 RepID=A0ABW4LX51_9BACI
MTDITVLFALAIVSLIIVMPVVAEDRLIAHYVRLPKPIGVGKGTTLLLGRLVSGFSIVVPMYLTVQNGVLAGGVFALGVVSSIFFYSYIISKSGNSLFDFLDQLAPLSKIQLTIICLGSNLVYLFLQVVLVGVTLHELIGTPYRVTIFIVTLFCMIYAGIGGIRGIRMLSFPFLAILFFSAMVIPLTLFLIKGIHPVYSNLSMTNSNLIIEPLSNLLIYFITFVCTTSFLFSDLYLRMRVLDIKEKRQRASLSYASFCWSAIPLAFTALTIYVLSQIGEASFENVLNAMKDEVSGFIFLCVLLSWVISFVVGIGTSLQGIISHLQLLHVPTEKEQWLRLKLGYLFGFIIVILLIIPDVSMNGVLSSIKWYLFFLVGMSVPIVTTMMFTHRFNFSLPLTSVVLLSSVWVVATIALSFYVQLLLTFLISCLLSFGFIFIKIKILQKQQK